MIPTRVALEVLGVGEAGGGEPGSRGVAMTSGYERGQPERLAPLPVLFG